MEIIDFQNKKWIVKAKVEGHRVDDPNSLKEIYGCDLVIKNNQNVFFILDEIKDAYDEINEEYNLYGNKIKKSDITGRLLELIFKKHTILFGNRLYHIGEASIKKKFLKYMFEIGSWKWKFGMNEFSIITPEKNLKFPYPIISVQFGTNSAQIGGSISVPTGSDIEIVINFIDPEQNNHNGENPSVARVDLITGKVTGRSINLDNDHNSSTHVLNRFYDNDWSIKDDYKSMVYNVKNVKLWPRLARGEFYNVKLRPRPARREFYNVKLRPRPARREFYN